MENKILEAYNAGKRIQRKGWTKEWIKKYNETSLIDELGIIEKITESFVWNFGAFPELWQIWHEDVEPETPKNPILEAYNAGKRISRKDWQGTIWIKKHSDTESIDGSYNINPYTWSFRERPEEWEIWHEDAEPETPKNPILEAYEAGIRIRMKKWDAGEWIQKQNDDFLINNKDVIYNKRYFIDREQFKTENWELYKENEAPHQPEEPQTEIQKAIKLLIENNYEVYFITKTQIVL